MYYIKQVLFVLFALLCFVSCSTSGQFDTADLYFEGLDALKTEDKAAAIRAFNRSISQNSQTVSLLAIEALLPLLYETEDYSAILDITDIHALSDTKEQEPKTDGDELQFLYEIDPNLLYRYRLLAMIQTNHRQTIDYITDWVTSQAFSREHFLFFESEDFTTFVAQNLNQQNKFFLQTLELIAFRSAVYKRDYTTSLKVGQPTKELLPLLYEAENYSAILAITDISPLSDPDLPDQEVSNDELPLFYKIDPNLLYRYRLLAMIQTNHRQTVDYITDWVTSQAFSKEHFLFFESEDFTTFAEQNLNEQNEFFVQTLELIASHQATYKRDYTTSHKEEQSEEDNPAKDDVEMVSSEIFENRTTLLLSDIGKALLYGSTNRIYYAQLLEEASESYPNGSEEAFMCHFYAARIYDWDNLASYRYRALQQFKAAMDEAATPELYDNALWYYLRTVNKTSSRAAISALQEFSPLWNDPYYFDDFLSTIAFSLLSAENWKGFYALYEVLLPYMSDESLSKYAYISGRLIEEGFLYNEFSIDAGYENNAKARKAAKKAQKAFFETAFNTIDGNLYYRIMAAEKLELSSAKILATILQREKNPPARYDEELEYILNKYIQRGEGQNVYPLYIKHSSAVSFDAAMKLSVALAQVNNPSVENNFQNNFYPESLRIASRSLNQAGKDISKKQMELLYPRFYTDYVTQMAEIYNLSESVLYALIRSESFFDHDVYSSAGAIGLTQLIPGTAGDVARKLKVTEYDLHNAELNIAFGAFYLNELIPRVDNSMLRALFSYNAGITNVRRWVDAYPEISQIPDLFLEVIPFAETRDYGRKLLSASAMYGMLYYGKTSSEIVDAIMQ